MVETWARAADALQTRPEWKPGVFYSRTMARLARGTSFSQRLALCSARAASCNADPRERLHVRIRGIAIAGGGLRGIQTLSFDTVVMLVVVVVVTRCRAASRVAAGMVLWLVVVGLTSTRNIKIRRIVVERIVWPTVWGLATFILSLYYRF